MIHYPNGQLARNTNTERQEKYEVKGQPGTMGNTEMIINSNLNPKLDFRRKDQKDYKPLYLV